MNRNPNLRKLVQFALLATIEVVLGLTPLGLIKVTVLEVDLKKKRIALTMLKNKGEKK